MRDQILFGFSIVISLDAKTCSVPQFIGASLRNFETIDLGIKSSMPLALNGGVNPDNTIFLTMESLYGLQPPHTKESPRFSKFVWRLIFQGS